MPAQLGPVHHTPWLTRTNEDCWDSAGTGGGSSWLTILPNKASYKQLCLTPPNIGGSASVHLDASVHRLVTSVLLPGGRKRQEAGCDSPRADTHALASPRTKESPVDINTPCTAKQTLWGTICWLWRR